MESAGHKGVILHSVAEDHKLGTAKAAPVGGALRQIFHRPPHESHGVHINARLGRAHVDAGTDNVRGGQRLGNGVDKDPIRLGHALLAQGGKAADEVDARGLGGPVQRLGKGGVIVRLRRGGHQCYGGDGDALVHNGDAVLLFDGLPRGHQMLGVRGDLVVNFVRGHFHIAVGAGQ